jgi:hypothetical protein
MKILFLFLLLSGHLFAQISPPTQTIKKRNGESARVAWNFTENVASEGLLYFSVKTTPDLNQSPIEFKQIPKSERQADIVVLFSKQFPDLVYYIVSAIYNGTKGESFPSNTISVQRIGKPPQ